MNDTDPNLKRGYSSGITWEERKGPAKNIKDAQKKQKETYDRKHLQEELSVGTEVMVENTAQKETG